MFTSFRIGFRAGYKAVAQPNKAAVVSDKATTVANVPAKIGKVVGKVARVGVKVLKGVGLFLLCVGEANRRAVARQHEAAVAETTGFMGVANVLFDSEHYTEQMKVREATSWAAPRSTWTDSPFVRSPQYV